MYDCGNKAQELGAVTLTEHPLRRHISAMAENTTKFSANIQMYYLLKLKAEADALSMQNSIFDVQFICSFITGSITGKEKLIRDLKRELAKCESG